MNNDLHFSSASAEWATPQDFFDCLNAQYKFTLDPCATAENAKCEKFYTKEQDGLAQSWANEVVFMNPPYGRGINKWIEKAHDSSLEGATVVCLIPARTDTAYWHKFIWDAERDTWRAGVRGRLLKGRLKFGDGTNAAPFPSALVIFTKFEVSK